MLRTVIGFTYSHKVVRIVVNNHPALPVSAYLTMQGMDCQPIGSGTGMAEQVVPTVPALKFFQGRRPRIKQLQIAAGQQVVNAADMGEKVFLFGGTDQNPRKG